MPLTSRHDIAEAVGTIDGLTASDYQPDIVKAGDVWVRFEGADRGPGDSFEYTWSVIVVLGFDFHDAEAEIDRIMPLVVDALDPVAFVDSFSTGSLSVGDGTSLPVLDIRCRKE